MPFPTQILTTGKYLNVISECGQEVPAPPDRTGKLRYGLGAGRGGFGEAIEAAYGRACKLLLDLLIKEHRLVTRLTSIKHYFLLDKVRGESAEQETGPVV